ncbi:MAG: sigma-70 family RNA polymerase sigma factor [Candidatus Competibacteraceae bacterium]|nr:sigma-70 family RNA polymerase sigma factor [Candidatus Competibacteraceae bacterium]
MTTNNVFTSEVLTYNDSLRYFALSLTHHTEDAEDLLQETLLKAFTYKDKFEENTNLKAWLFTIMKNIFINNYRKQAKVKTIFDGSKDLFYLNIPEGKKNFDPDSRLNFKEINHMMHSLGEEYRVPLSMYVEGYKYKEIADEMKLPIGTVKSRIFLARRQMMEKVEA